MEDKIIKENINQNQIQNEENNQVINQQPAPEIIPAENQKPPQIDHNILFKYSVYFLYNVLK
jgi:hypothetical protein